MHTWGLGIEHEMRVRFQHNINILDIKQHYIREITKKFKYIPNYLFINSNLLYNYYRKYCNYIVEDYYKKHYNAHQELKSNKKSKDHDQNSIYQIYHKISIDTDPITYIQYCAVNNLNYPLEHAIYFNPYSEKWMEFFYQYIIFYSKRFFFSSKNFHIIDNNENERYLTILSYEIIPEMNLLVKKNVIEINEKLKKGDYEKKFKNVLESFIKKYQLNSFQIQNNDYYRLKKNKQDSSIFTLAKLESKIKKNIHIPSTQEIEDLLMKIIEMYPYEKELAYSKLHKNNDQDKKSAQEKNNDKNNQQYNNEKNKKKFLKIYEKNIDLIHFIITLYKLDIPETDYSSQVAALEFKTYDYQNNNYKKQLDDLISIESLFFTIINIVPELLPFIDVFGKIEYHQTGSLENTITLNKLEGEDMFQQIDKDYAGSFHVWITIPYESSTSPEDFAYQHSCLGNRLQLLEPIFSSYFTSPDIQSIGNGLTHSRTSLRQFLNAYAGYGTSDVSYLNGIEKEKVEIYYLSKEDVFRNKYISLYDWVPVIDSHNKKIMKNYDGLNTRAGTVQFYQKYFESYGTQFSLKNNKHKNIEIDNYLLKLFQNTNISPENDIGIPLGADIRTLEFNRIFHPELDENYKKIIILEKNTFVQYYFDKKNQKIVSNPKFKEKEYKQLLKNGRVGIEFRIFDHQPTANLIQFLALCAQLVVYSMNHFQKLETNDIFIYKQLWHNEMVQSMIQGFEYKLSKAYTLMIEKEFKIQLDKKNKTELNGVQFFEMFYDKMNHKFMNSKKYKSIYTKLYVPRNDIFFENFNQKVWTYNFYLYLQNHPKILNQLLSVIYSTSNKKEKKKEILSLLGDSFSYNLSKIMTIME